MLEILKSILSILGITLLFAFIYFLFSFINFNSVLLEDVRYNHGKKLSKRWQKEKGFWRKFFFIDIKDKVVPWHYVMFWINFVLAVLLYAGLVAYVLRGIEKLDTVTVVILILYLLSSASVMLVRCDIHRYYKHPISKHQKAKIKKKYRKGKL